MMGLRMPSVRNINTYQGAADLFAKAKPRTVEGSGTHFLPDHRTRFTGISKRGEDIVFTYHSTDVVRWSPDSTCTVDLSYQSLSTCTFAARFCPYRTGFGSEGRLICAGGLYYRPKGLVRLGTDGNLLHPEQDTVPFQRRRTDRKAAKAVLKAYGYTEFVEWYKPMATMLGKHNIHRDTRFTSWGDITAALRDRELWTDILKDARPCFGASQTQFLSALRGCIYEDSGDVIYYEPHISAPSYSVATAWLKRE